MKNYQANIAFYYEAHDEHDAVKIADDIASYIESNYPNKIEAKVMDVELEEK